MKTIILFAFLIIGCGKLPDVNITVQPTPQASPAPTPATRLPSRILEPTPEATPLPDNIRVTESIKCETRTPVREYCLTLRYQVKVFADSHKEVSCLCLTFGDEVPTERSYVPSDGTTYDHAICPYLDRTSPPHTYFIALETTTQERLWGAYERLDTLPFGSNLLREAFSDAYCTYKDGDQ